MGKNTSTIDWLTIIVLFCLSSFGLFVLLTLDKGLFSTQLIYVVIGMVLIFACSKIDPVFLWWFAPFAYILGNILLVTSYIGPEIRGAHRWLQIGSMQIQPSEITKPLFLLAFSFFMTKFSPRNLRNIPILTVLFIVPFLLVFRQPDLGSSIVYASLWVAMLIGGGLPLSFLITSVIAVVLIMPGIWHFLLPYQKARIESFINPALDPAGSGYNALQAMIAVGSGQLFGRGLGLGTQSHLRFLPEHSTDFIFASLIEELGFVGGVLVIFLYIILLIQILRTFFRTKAYHLGVYIFSFGFFAMLLSQIVINTGMNMGLLPITGITLPFVSYGGSSIISSSISFGLLWSLKRINADSSVIAFDHHT